MCRGDTENLDPLGNATTITQGDGTSIAQVFDGLNRLTSRTVTPASGVAPPVTETYAYRDGERRVEAARGTVGTHLTYDSLGRLISDETVGHTVSYQHDGSGHPNQITYSSGFAVTQSWNARSQLTSLGVPRPPASAGWATCRTRPRRGRCVTDGQHRMNAAIELFEERGDPQYVQRLLEEAEKGYDGRRFLVEGNPPMNSRSMPHRAWW